MMEWSTDDEDDSFRGGSPQQHYINESRSSNSEDPRDLQEDNISGGAIWPSHEPEMESLEAALNEALQARDWSQVRDLAKKLLILEGKAPAVSPVLSRLDSFRSSGTMRYDRLTVFQANPLVWMNNRDELMPIEPLDFTWERDALKDALKDARIDGSNIEVVFDIATTDRLNAFLSSKKTSPILHLSCHGFPDLLALEDGQGGTHFINDNYLEEFYSSPNQRNSSLKVVFVSACHSRSIGDSFHKAGIPHVICCKTNKERLRDSAAIEFTKSFYRALSHGKTLQQAFFFAKNQVKLSPLVLESHIEMDKFVLLPERDDAYHEVEVFFTNNFFPSLQSELRPSRKFTGIPPPPKYFVGRQVEAYDVIKALRNADIVHLVGLEGVGKGLLASVVANYVNERKKLLFLDEVLWCPPIDHNSHIPLDEAFDDLFDLLATAPDILESAKYQECRRRIILRLGKKQTLLVLDARRLAITDVSMLGPVLQDFLNRLTSIKMLILCQGGKAAELKTHTEQKFIKLEPLTFEASATLFAKLCPYVSAQSEHADPLVHTVANFVNLIFRRDAFRKSRQVHENMSKRSADLFTELGGGCPQTIRDRAMTMTPTEYKSIIIIAKKRDVAFHFHTRHELDTAILRTNLEIHNAQETGLYQKAQEKYDLVQELMRRRKTMHSKQKLSQKLEQLLKRHRHALRETRHSEAQALQKEIKEVQQQLANEVSAQIDVEEETQDPLSQDEYEPAAESKDIEGVKNNGKKSLVPLVAKIKVDDVIADTGSVCPRTAAVPLAKFQIQNKNKNGSQGFSLQINRGDVTSFSHTSLRTGVVVASNEACTGGRGVLNATTRLGGQILLEHVEALSTVQDNKFGPVRCLAGGAELVGPGPFGDLDVRYVIFAVAPWFTSENELHSQLFLTAAYHAALELAREANVQALGFSLLGASCRGGDGAEEFIKVGFDVIANYGGYPELKEIHLFGYTPEEANHLMNASRQYDFDQSHIFRGKE